MSNPHPNTSGLRPFNKMDPDEAKRIRRLGGLSHARRNAIISEDVWKIQEALQQEHKKYRSNYDPEMDIYAQVCKIYYNPWQHIDQRLKAKKYIDSIFLKDAKRIDEQNALQYKTAPLEYQLANNYVNGFQEGQGDICDMKHADDYIQKRIQDIIKQNQQSSDTCSETNDTSAVKEN